MRTAVPSRKQVKASLAALAAVSDGPTQYDIATDSWKPIRDYLIVRQDPHHVMPSGILVVPPKGIVESQRQWGHTGTVVAAGPGIWKDFGTKHVFQPTVVKPGDRITWGEFLPNAKIEHNGERCIVIREPDVCGIVEQAA